MKGVMDQLTEYVRTRINEKRSEWPGHLAALDVAAWRELSDLVDGEMRAAVTRAREQGATWQNIADVFGTTRASAQQRFGESSPRRAGRASE